MQNPTINRRKIVYILLLAFIHVPAFAFDLYWTEEESIVASNIDGTNVTTVFDGTGMNDVAIDIRVTDDNLYWTERHVGKIWRADRDGGNAEVIIDGSAEFSSLHFMEWDAGNETIYVSDYSNGIFEIDLTDGNAIQNLDGSGLSNFTGVAQRNDTELLWLTAADSLLYTTDLTNTPSFDTIELSGGNQTYGLAYDASTDILYYTDFGAGTLHSYNLQTQSNQLIASGFTGLLGVKLSPSGSHLLLAERGAGISAYQIDNGATARIVESTGVDFGLAVDADPEQLEGPTHLFHSDFQNDVPDAAPGAPWTSVSDDPETRGTVRVREDSDELFLRGPGNHYLDFDDIGESATILWALDAVPGDDSVVTVSFDFFEPLTSAGNRFVLNLYNQEGTDGRIDRVQFEGGSFRDIDDVSYTLGTPHRIDYILNSGTEAVTYGDEDEFSLAGSSSDIWINGERVVAGYRDANSQADGPLRGIDLRSFSNSPVTMYVDDFGVQPGAQLSEIRDGFGDAPELLFFDDFNAVAAGEEPSTPPWRNIDTDPTRGSADVIQDTENLFDRGTDNQYVDFHDPEDADSPLILWAHQTIDDGPRVFTVSMHFHEPEDSVGNRFNIRMYDNDPDFWLGYDIDALQFEGGSIRNIGDGIYEKGQSYWLNWVINRSDDPVTYNNGENTVPSFSSDVWIDDQLVAADFLNSEPTDLESTHLGGFDLRTFSSNSVRMFVDEFAIRSGAGLHLPSAEDSSGFDAWKDQHFTEGELNDPLVSGPDANPLGDGISNLLKYAFDLDPWLPARESDRLPKTAVVDGELQFTYTRRTDAPDVSYTVEVSDDLVNWAPDTEAFTPVLVDQEGNLETVTVQANGYSADESRGFFRLLVTRN